jgi:starvation-inducible DNA-binding protein
VSEDVEGYTDLIAERIVQLGGIAVGTLQPGEGKSTLPAYSLTTTGGKEHVAALSYALAFFGESIRKAVGQADVFMDAVTADILTEVLRGAEKDLWLVESNGPTD